MSSREGALDQKGGIRSICSTGRQTSKLTTLEVLCLSAASGRAPRIEYRLDSGSHKIGLHTNFFTVHFTKLSPCSRVLTPSISSPFVGIFRPQCQVPDYQPEFQHLHAVVGQNLERGASFRVALSTTSPLSAFFGPRGSFLAVCSFRGSVSDLSRKLPACADPLSTNRRPRSPAARPDRIPSSSSSLLFPHQPHSLPEHLPPRLAGQDHSTTL